MIYYYVLENVLLNQEISASSHTQTSEVTDFFFFLILLAVRKARGILILRPMAEPEPLALEVPSLNHWTAREVP